MTPPAPAPTETTPNPPETALTAPIPVQVIGYASIGTEYVVPTGVKVLLGFLAALHLMIGIPLIVWPVASMMGQIMYNSLNSGGLALVAIGFAAGAPNVACGIAMLVKRRRATWRGIHVVLAVLCGIELPVFIGGAALAVAYKDAQGWDSLALVFGVFLMIAGSIPFWLHALSKLLLLRPSVRRAFLFQRDEPVRVQRVSTITMMSLYGIALLVGAVAYIIK